MIALALLLAAAAPDSAAAAERAFAAAAQADGQWTAFRAFAAPDAVLLSSGAVPAARVLRDLKDPPASVAWQPSRTVTSCDGRLAFSTGPWQREGGRRAGRYFTIWQRQPDGAWKWIFDGGTEEPTATPASNPVPEERAACRVPTNGPATPGGQAGGASPDGSLRWRVDPGPIGTSHLLRVDYSDGRGFASAVSVILSE